jgi:hypothetical protein
VSRGVVRGRDLIPAAPDDFSFAHNDRTKRPAATSAHFLDGDTYRLLHELRFHRRKVKRIVRSKANPIL